ncbi:hypothetical protein LguiA_026046 [Lonicera macranthoides]
MISGKHPDQAMTYIWDAQIFLVIFSVPHQLELPASEERLCVACMSYALRIMQIIEDEDYAFDVVSLHNAAEKFMSLIPHIMSAEDIRMAEIDSKVEVADFSGDKLRKLVGNDFSPILQLSWHQLDVSTLSFCCQLLSEGYIFFSEM